MTKRELKRIQEERRTEGESVTTTLTTSEDACEVNLKFSSTMPMDSLDLLLALIDWCEDFALDQYNKGKARHN